MNDILRSTDKLKLLPDWSVSVCPATDSEFQSENVTSLDDLSSLPDGEIITYNPLTACQERFHLFITPSESTQLIDAAMLKRLFMLKVQGCLAEFWIHDNELDLATLDRIALTLGWEKLLVSSTLLSYIFSPSTGAHELCPGLWIVLHSPGKELPNSDLTAIRLGTMVTEDQQLIVNLTAVKKDVCNQLAQSSNIVDEVTAYLKQNIFQDARRFEFFPTTS